MTSSVTVSVNPKITAEQLYSFYERNGICEAGFAPEVAARVLEHSSVIVGAFDGDRLVGLARAMFDGVSADVSEISLELAYQGAALKFRNGSLIEADESGLGGRLARRLIEELQAMGASFISVYVVEDCEEAFYEHVGFKRNDGHAVYIIDERPYVREES